MNLIEKVGGIEKAKTLNSMLEKHAVPEDWKISIVYGMWQRSSVGFTHSDLRTAIAQHDCKHNWQDVTAIGNTERVFICSYCSKQKSAPFCIDKFDVEGAEEFLRDREQGSNASEFEWLKLIERLGGYEKAKITLEAERQGKNIDPVIYLDGDEILIDVICDALLQYRIEHGVFEVGDLVVKSKYDRGPLEVVAIQCDQLILGKYSRVAVSEKSVRHADHPVQDREMIQLSGNTGGLETAEMIDYSPCVEVINR